MPEYFKEEITSARLVSNPGCFSTGALLGMLPLDDLLHDIDSAPIIDAKSGASGAGGRTEDDGIQFISVNENFKAYKIFFHQHQPEIQQYLTELSSYNKERSGEIIFTPHLLPVNRGILSTIYLRFNRAINSSEIRNRFSKFASSNEFIHFLDQGNFPDLRMTQNSNRIMIGVESDDSNKNWIIITSLDNLVKGASGQAIQNMNLMFGFDEKMGLI